MEVPFLVKDLDGGGVGGSPKKYPKSSNFSSSFDATLMIVGEAKGLLHKKNMAEVDSSSVALSIVRYFIKESRDFPVDNTLATQEDSVVRLKEGSVRTASRKRRFRRKNKKYKNLVGFGGPVCPTLAWSINIKNRKGRPSKKDPDPIMLISGSLDPIHNSSEDIFLAQNVGRSSLASDSSRWENSSHIDNGVVPAESDILMCNGRILENFHTSSDSKLPKALGDMGIVKDVGGKEISLNQTHSFIGAERDVVLRKV